MRINRLVVFGVGLIGGSFALALKRAGRVGEVVGVGRSRANLERALELGVIDAIATEPAAAVAGADLVLLATPVGQMARICEAIAPHLPPACIVTDAGSTKGDVAALMRRCLPAQLAHCVPAHPIAGSELSGAAAAQYGLFDKRSVVLTPLAESAADAVATVGELWRAAGATIETMTPAEHDSVFASVSHLPHLLAFTYVDAIAAKPDAARRFSFASTGFRDFTRIAGSHPEMWRDISLANREALLTELADFRAGLDRLDALLQAGDAEGLESLFRNARAARTEWFARFSKR